MKSPQKTICIIVDDMFFSSKIESAAKKLGVVMMKVRNHDEFQTMAEGKTVDLIVIDLASRSIDTEEVFSGIRDSETHGKTFCIGYLPHMEQELAGKFREKGIDFVLPRSEFSREMSAIIEKQLIARSTVSNQTFRARPSSLI